MSASIDVSDAESPKRRNGSEAFDRLTVHQRCIFRVAFCTRTVGATTRQHAAAVVGTMVLRYSLLLGSIAGAS